ncbi:hypothetical protein Bbelb_029430 [Branchiostoma belcheri]|nr:hypothetical protein Bbelb_029430 [Branchiostoma belcheri]
MACVAQGWVSIIGRTTQWRKHQKLNSERLEQGSPRPGQRRGTAQDRHAAAKTSTMSDDHKRSCRQELFDPGDKVTLAVLSDVHGKPDEQKSPVWKVAGQVFSPPKPCDVDALGADHG